MRAAGLGGQVRVETGDMTEEGGYRAARRLLALTEAERPTAIFAANDLSCVGALSAAAAAGVRCRPGCRWSGSTTRTWPGCERCG